MNKCQLKSIISGAKTAVITYRERHMIDRFTCIDNERTVRIYRPWIVSGLLYGYLDRFNIRSIPLEDILQAEV